MGSVQPRLTFGREQAVIGRGPARRSVLERDAGRPRSVEGSQESPAPRFAALAVRVAGFHARLHSPHDAVRLRLLKELTHFRPRDERHYPRFFQYLLQDPASELRWQSARRLAAQLGPARRLPRLGPLRVPMHGVVDATNEGSLDRLRRRTVEGGARLVWGLEVLGMVADEPSLPLFEAHLDDRAPKLRLRAALAACRVGRGDEGLDVLRGLAEVPPSPEEPMVPVLAAEALVRAGEPRGLSRLVEHARAVDWTAFAFGPQQLLEDLTGAFAGSPDDWAAYLDRHGPG